MAYPADDPIWAEQDITFGDGTDNKKKPTPNLEAFGWAPNEFPTNNELNWLLNNLTLQIAELKQQVAAPSQIPVGVVITIDGDSSNPATLFGYGTWQVYGQGRVIVGVGSTTDANGNSVAFNAGATGGEFSHTLTQSEMPQHSHTGGITGKSGGAGYDIEGYPSQAPSNDNYKTVNTGSIGGNQAHNNIQPYVVAYLWKRVA